jgi:hypothetical protein
MYQIIGGDGKEYGPVSTELLRQWAREGRISAQTQVRAAGATDWQPLSGIPELAEILNAPPPIEPPLALAGPAPGELFEGDYDLDIGGCVTRAWEVLRANFWLMVGGCAIYLLIIGGISGFAQIPFIGILFSLASIIITGPLMGGVYGFLLRVLRGQQAEFGEVFSGFRDRMGQLILSYIVPMFISMAAAVPGAIVMAVPIFIMVKNHAAHPGWIALAVVGLAILLVPVIYLSICWTFAIPLVMDRRLDFWTAMKVSRGQVSRHWWTMLGLFVVIGLINLAGMLACCVGMFVTMPLALAALLLAYETLFTPPAASTSTGSLLQRI